MPENAEGRRLPDEEKAPEVKKSPPNIRARRIKRMIFSALLGLSAGTGAVITDHQVTDGLFSEQVHSVLTDYEYRLKLGESIASGEIAGDIADLFRAAEVSAEGETAAAESSLSLGEKLPIKSSFLEKYFQHYEIRSVNDGQSGPKRPIFLAEIDNPAVVDFNIGTEDSPSFDPWVTAERTGDFVTIPTNQSDPVDGGRTHVFYSGYMVDGKPAEYVDTGYVEHGKDSRAIRAGALVLFEKDGRRSVVAVDSRDFSLKLGDQTRQGKVIAIESFAASISSANESADIQSLKGLVGRAKVPEYTRQNYESVIATYTFEDGGSKTFTFGLYTDKSSLPEGVSTWSIEDQLSPQDFYATVRQYGQELGAQGWVMLLPDPGPSSYLYDREKVMGDVNEVDHFEMFIRPQHSLVQRPA